jgi:hypothetical protein
VAAAQDLFEGADEERPGGAKLLPVSDAEPAQEPLSTRCNLQRSLSAVCHARASLDEPTLDRTPNEVDRAVVSNLEPFRDERHRGSLVATDRLENEQQLMLLRLDARLSGRDLAEREEAPDLVPELGEGSILAAVQFACRSHVVRRTLPGPANDALYRVTI